MKDWVRLQKNLYRQSRIEADRLIGRKPIALAKYERRFQNDNQNFSASTSQAFVSELNRADFFFLGDFHTLRQSQRMLLRLLRDPKVLPPKILGLEVLTESEAKKIDQTLKHLPSFERDWGSSTETYRELFELAKKRGIQILGLKSPRASLEARDVDAARLLAAQQKRTWILFGEYHCARPHLPGRLQSLRPESNILILQQNDDRESLKRLSHFSRKKTIFLESSTNQMGRPQLFCVLHTPVWMKWQSFVERHLNAHDDPSMDTDVTDGHEQIEWCLRTLYEFLKDPRYPLNLGLKDLLDFQTFSSQDETFEKVLSHLPRPEKLNTLKQLQSGGVGVASDSRKIFLNEMTLNACAHAASSYLYRRCSDIRNQDSDFFRATLVETLSYFLSKILNHSRRSQTWQDWRDLADSPYRRKEALAVLRTRDFPTAYAQRSRWLKSMKVSEWKLSLPLARTLADALFEAFLAQEFSKNRILRLMTTPLHSEREAFEILVEIKSVGEAFSRAVRTPY